MFCLFEWAWYAIFTTSMYMTLVSKMSYVRIFCEIFYLSFDHHSSTLKDGRAGNQREQQPGGRRYCRGHGVVLPTDFLHIIICYIQATESATTQHIRS